MAREGLRTLVVAKKVITDEQYTDFDVSLLNLKYFETMFFMDVYF